MTPRVPMNPPEAESTQSKRFAPALTLLFIAILVNYVDRGNLSIAAPLLKDELGISASQLGLLLSAFFWSYTAMQFVSGWLVDRFNASFVIAAGYLIWSLATSATGVVYGFAMLAFMRLLLGIGESVAFPCCSKLLAQHLPESSRGFANGVIISAIRCGPAVGTFGAGLLMQARVCSRFPKRHCHSTRHPAAAFVLGSICGTLLRKLSSIFSCQLASFLSRS
ncbi:MAG: hypothetical protein DMG64_01300 [Acidobacteria bacterium]|nr:MAG: hypothetical protein DMG64_01300 [Acidobacteriota bacterium]